MNSLRKPLDAVDLSMQEAAKRACSVAALTVLKEGTQPRYIRIPPPARPLAGVCVDSLSHLGC